MNSFIKYLNCGRVEERSNRSSVDFIVTNFSDIYEKIIPLFEKYTILGCKYLDYVDFCKVAELMKTRVHLTQEGLDKIIDIKSGPFGRIVEETMAHYNSYYYRISRKRFLGAVHSSTSV
jgi:hypothetical protein